MENTLLNLIPSSYIPEVHLSQYDIGRELTFKLMDGNTEYSVPSGATVTVKATKPSGLGFVVSGTFSGNIVTIVNTETMTNESGRFSAELSISSGATLLGTSNFIFNIERSPHPEGTTDGDAETLIPELTLLVNEIRESNAKVEDMTASASPLPSGSNPTAEYDAENNNLAFGIPTSEVTAEDLYKAFIVKSASGSIASFSDGGDDLLMKSLKVNIVPKQSGSGDPSPSNVRPISGWDSVGVNHTGKNLSSLPTRLGYWAASNGSFVSDTTWASTEKIKVKGGVTYRVSTSFVNRWCGVIAYDSDGTFISSIGEQAAHTGRATDISITTPSNCCYIGISLANPTQTAIDLSTITDLQVEVGNVETSYEPYNGSTITTNLGQTVYGGTLDVVSGELSIDKVLIDLGTSSGGFAKVTTGEHTKFYKNLSNGSQSSNPYGLCSQYAMTTNENFPNDNTCRVYGSTLWGGFSRCMIRDDSKANLTAEEFKTAMNGVQLVYELATPTEIQLTPTEVKTLLGANNIWSESGTVEVEYRADSTLAYEELANAIISLGGNI